MPWQPRRLRMENLESRRLLAAVHIPDDLVGQVGAEVAAPVMVDSAQGIRGAEIRIQYDPSLLTLSPEDVTAGSAWDDAEDAEVVANVDPTTGTVIVFIAASQELAAGPGSLVVFTFGVRDGAEAGDETVLDLVAVALNEGDVPVTPAPIAGADPTDGLITIEGQPGVSDRVAGFVYADTNNDNLPGSLEGIPGVEVTLVNVQTEEVFETTTDASGAFEFTELPAGQYRMIQTHPQAYINGGPNERSLDLAAGGNLENQNFRELGLRPAYVYNRLLTTTALPVGSDNWIEVLEQINVDAAANADDDADADADDDAEAASAASQFSAFAAGSSAASAPAAAATSGADEDSQGLSESVLASPPAEPEGESSQNRGSAAPPIATPAAAKKQTRANAVDAALNNLW